MTDELPQTKRTTRMAGGFNMVSRKWFERQSNDKRLPKWERVGYYCVAHMRPDSHCPLPAGALVEFLGTSPREVRRTIKAAIERDRLGYGSTDRCLIAPHGFEFNMGNYRSRVCEFH